MYKECFWDIKQEISIYIIITQSIAFDKLAMLNVLLMFCKKLQQFRRFSERLNIDEKMIPYADRHSFKMCYSYNLDTNCGFLLLFMVIYSVYKFVWEKKP